MNRQSAAFQELLGLMQLEPLEVNLFRGASRDIGTERVFGGQVLAQALVAASSTVEERLAHSLHAYFLRAGDPDAPIVYSVDRSRDGRSFSARRVVAIQHGRPIFTLAASFQVDEVGLEHQFGMPEVPGPDQVRPMAELPREEFDHLPKNIQRWLDRFGPFEFRPVRGSDPDDQAPQPPYKELWFRLHGELEDEPSLHRAMLANVSDFHLIVTSRLPPGRLAAVFLRQPQYQQRQGPGARNDLRSPGAAGGQHRAGRRHSPAGRTVGARFARRLCSSG